MTTLKLQLADPDTALWKMASTAAQIKQNLCAQVIAVRGTLGIEKNLVKCLGHDCAVEALIGKR